MPQQADPQSAFIPLSTRPRLHSTLGYADLYDSLNALARQTRRARAAQGLPAAEFCGEHLQDWGCGEPIAAARRAAVPGCQLCVACQGRREKSEGVR